MKMIDKKIRKTNLHDFSLLTISNIEKMLIIDNIKSKIMIDVTDEVERAFELLVLNKNIPSKIVFVGPNANLNMKMATTSIKYLEQVFKGTDNLKISDVKDKYVPNGVAVHKEALSPEEITHTTIIESLGFYDALWVFCVVHNRFHVAIGTVGLQATNLI